MPRTGFLGAHTLPLGILAASLGCQPPPDFVVADAGAQTDAPWPQSDGAVCSTPIALDSLASRRATCSFQGGAKVTDTLPISEVQRASIPIQHVIVVMKENRSFDHLLG